VRIPKPAVLTVVVAVAACDHPFEFPAPVGTVRVSPDSAALEAGDSVQLAAQAYDSTGHALAGIPFTWTTSADSLATVSATGLVRTLRPGTAAITATAENASGQAGVTIAPRISGVGVDQGAVVTVPGAVIGFTAYALDPQGDTLLGRPIAWTSGDTEVFTVTAAGLVTARASGSALLTASLDTVRDTVRISVRTATFVSLTAGEADHTCGLTTDSLVLCWGANDLGQLAVPALTQSPAPLTAPFGLKFVRVQAGGTFTCGEVPGDVPYCWGSNFRGRLGVGATPSSSPVPLPVATAPSLTGLSTGWNDTCGLAAGTAYCWGENPGAGGSAPVTPTPTALQADSAFATLEASVGFVCGLTAGGTPMCWGVNALGQLGTGDDSQSTTPRTVRGGLTLRSLGSGSGHTCGLTSAGAAFCWGLNSSGQLGTGDTTSSLTPVAAATGMVFAALDGGGTTTCGLLAADSTAWCWGDGALAPVAVSGGLHFRLITVGDRHVCGLAADGRAYCWGANERGQLGDGTLTARASPTVVLGQP